MGQLELLDPAVAPSNIGLPGAPAYAPAPLSSLSNPGVGRTARAPSQAPSGVQSVPGLEGAPQAPGAGGRGSRDARRGLGEAQLLHQRLGSYRPYQTEGPYRADQTEGYYRADQTEGEAGWGLGEARTLGDSQIQYSFDRRQVGGGLGEASPARKSRIFHGADQEQGGTDRHLEESYSSDKSQISYGSTQGQVATGVFTQLTSLQGLAKGGAGRRQARGAIPPALSPTGGGGLQGLQGLLPPPPPAFAAPTPMPLLLVNMQGGTPSADSIGTVEYTFSANTIPADFPGAFPFFFPSPFAIDCSMQPSFLFLVHYSELAVSVLP